MIAFEAVKFRGLFAALMILLAATPFLQPGRLGGVLLQLFFTSLLLSALYAVGAGKRARVLGATLAVTALLVGWTGRGLSLPDLFGVGVMLSAAFLVFTIKELLGYVIRARQVTSEVVFGAICVYMLIGVVAALLFGVLDLWQPGALHLPTAAGSVLEDATQFANVMYYSFVTLTTLGYGDITPVSRLARSLATMEAVSGQLYLAVLVARVVGMHIVHSMSSSE